MSYEIHYPAYILVGRANHDENGDILYDEHLLVVAPALSDGTQRVAIFTDDDLARRFAEGAGLDDWEYIRFLSPEDLSEFLSLVEGATHTLHAEIDPNPILEGRTVRQKLFLLLRGPSSP